MFKCSFELSLSIVKIIKLGFVLNNLLNLSYETSAGLFWKLKNGIEIFKKIKNKYIIEILFNKSFLIKISVINQKIDKDY